MRTRDSDNFDSSINAFSNMRKSLAEATNQQTRPSTMPAPGIWKRFFDAVYVTLQEGKEADREVARERAHQIAKALGHVVELHPVSEPITLKTSSESENNQMQHPYRHLRIVKTETLDTATVEQNGSIA